MGLRNEECLSWILRTLFCGVIKIGLCIAARVIVCQYCLHACVYSVTGYLILWWVILPKTLQKEQSTSR